MSNPNLHSDKVQLSAAEREFENNIRPSLISEFAGQEQLIENLRVFIKAAKMRGEEIGRAHV